MRFPTISPTLKVSNLFWRIKESSSNGNWQQVFYHFRDLKKAGAGVRSTDFNLLLLFPPILKACLSLSFRHGQSVHACLIKQGFESFSCIGNSLVDYYLKSGTTFDSALSLFDCMTSRDSVSWNIIILGHLEQGALEEGLWLFLQGRVAGFEPNTATLVLVIHACRSLKATHYGLKVHGYIITTGFWAIASVQNSLLSMYVDIEMETAHKLFDDMPARDVISWSVMVGGYVQSDEAELAFQLFREMLSECEIEIDGQIMVNIIKACIRLRNELSIGKMVHGFLIHRGFNFDLFVGNSLIDMYSRLHDTESAFRVLIEMPRRNVISWNSLLSGFVSNDEYSEALTLFDSMRNAGIEADEVTLVNILQVCKHFSHQIHCKSIHSTIIRRGYEMNDLVVNSLIDAYAKCNLVTLAWKLFSNTKRRDTVTWSTMIAGFTHCGMLDEAIAVFRVMNQVQEEKPNAITMLNLLEACSVSAELNRSKSAHGIAIRRGLADDVAVGTAILDAYSKCGAVEASEKVFDQISCKNIISWSAMIAAYGMNGLPHDALTLLGKMKARGLKPNPVTMLSVLSACSHGGLIEEGLLFFEQLVRDHGAELRLEHYSCMVDLLARAGKLDSAMELIKEEMPDGGLRPGPSAWGAFLSACRSHGNSKLGADAASHVLELEPSNSAGYLLASSMYAASGLWVDAARMRWLVKERGARMLTGYSLIHVNDKACKFVAGDNNKRHPCGAVANNALSSTVAFADETYIVSEQLHSCMKMDNRRLQDEVAFFE